MTAGPATGRRARLGGVADAVRQGRVGARLLVAADSRSLVRTLFLASAVRSGLLVHLGAEPTLDELARRTGTGRPERLAAWLQVGVDLGELGMRDGRYRARGRRARALAEGDELLGAHYRSVLDYQVGPYSDLEELLADAPGAGRDDLDRHAGDIARVSMAAAPFVARVVRDVVTELRPVTVLDVGCGTGVYTRVALAADPTVRVAAIDLSDDVATATRRQLSRAGLGDRCQVHVGDVRQWLAPADQRFGLIMMLNDIYYFPPPSRVELFRQLARSLAGGGQLLVATMTAPGSVAASHLHLMLTSQAGAAALPSRAGLVADLAAAGLDVVTIDRPVPTEPFVAVRATATRS